MVENYRQVLGFHEIHSLVRVTDIKQIAAIKFSEFYNKLSPGTLGEQS